MIPSEISRDNTALSVTTCISRIFVLETGVTLMQPLKLLIDMFRLCVSMMEFMASSLRSIYLNVFVNALEALMSPKVKASDSFITSPALLLTTKVVSEV